MRNWALRYSQVKNAAPTRTDRRRSARSRLPRVREERLHLDVKGSQIVLQNTPNGAVLDKSIAVDQDIAERDDLGPGNLGMPTPQSFGDLRHGVADGDEFLNDRTPNQFRFQESFQNRRLLGTRQCGPQPQ